MYQGRAWGSSDFLSGYVGAELGYTFPLTDRTGFNLGAWTGFGPDDSRIGLKTGVRLWLDPRRNLDLSLTLFHAEVNTKYEAFAGGAPLGFVGTGKGPGIGATTWFNTGLIGLGAGVEYAHTGTVTNVVGPASQPRSRTAGPIRDHFSIYAGARARGWPAAVLVGALVISRFLQDGPLLPCC